MGDLYINSDTGDDGTGTGTSGAPWATLAHAHTQAVADDRIVVQYAGGTPYAISSKLTISKARLTITGQDSAGVIFADDPEGYNRDELPHVDVTASTGIGQSTNTEIHFHGLELDGGGVSSVCWNPGSGTSTWTGCYLHDFTSNAMYTRAATIRECKFEACNYGVETAQSNVLVHACIFVDCNYAASRFGSHTGCELRNVTFYLNGTSGQNYVMDSATAWTLENCLFVDGLTRYGCDDNVQTTGNAYSSDSNTIYHHIANYNGTPHVSNDLELDPQFVDAGAGNFYIQNATLQTGGTANSVPRLYDGTPMPATPPIGALGAEPSAAPATGTYTSTVKSGVAYGGGAVSGFSVYPPPNEWAGESLTDLEAAVLLSLFSDRRVEAYELPAPETDRRGFWGDSVPAVEGDEWGSRLWLLDRAKIGGVTEGELAGVASPELAEAYIREALQWMIDDGVCTSIEVVSVRRVNGSTPLGIEGEIVIVRDESEPVEVRFADLWRGLTDG